MTKEKTGNSFLKLIKDYDEVSTLSTMPQASYSLDINLEKLMYCAFVVIHKIEMDSQIEFNPHDEVQVTAENFYSLLYDQPLKPTRSLTDAEMATRKVRMQNVRRIMERAYMNFDSSPVMLVPIPTSEVPEKVPMITRLHYEPKTKIFTFEFHPSFYKYFYKFLHLKNNSFSKHELRQIMPLSSYYSLRLYRILNNELWRSNSLVLTYDDLRRIFQKENLILHQRLKKIAIEPAVKEINELTNIVIKECNYLKENGKYNAVEFVFQQKNSYISKKMEKALEKLKLSYLQTNTPWSDDLSHFLASDRSKYFEAPTKLSRKQIAFLISSPVFLLDYSNFYSNADTETAKVVMKALLTNRLDVVNNFKKIDLDYYFALSYVPKEDGEDQDQVYLDDDNDQSQNDNDDED